ncbi:MAG: hypothetical protein ABNH26_03580 [Celeribacter sp.]
MVSITSAIAAGQRVESGGTGAVLADLIAERRLRTYPAPSDPAKAPDHARTRV